MPADDLIQTPPDLNLTRLPPDLCTYQVSQALQSSDLHKGAFVALLGNVLHVYSVNGISRNGKELCRDDHQWDAGQGGQG